MQTDLIRDIVRKTVVTPHGHERLRREVANLRQLEQTGIVPRILQQTANSLDLEYIDGQSMADWLRLQSDWCTAPPPITQASERLRAYVALEMRLLQAGVMYRDLNLQHVIFTPQSVRIIDLEAAEYNPRGDIWRVTNRRGTYETMAPEEFVLGELLTPRTATYRVAVVAHLALAGQLPFRFMPGSRRKVYQWRRNHPPEVSSLLPRSVRRVLCAALQPQPVRRHKDPARLLQAISDAYGWSVEVR